MAPPANLALNAHCYYPDYNSNRGICGGATAGTCNNVTFLCECNSGYTGRSDWVNLEGFDCQMLITLSTFLWAILLFLGCLVIVKIPPIMSHELSKNGYSFKKTVDKEYRRTRCHTGVFIIICHLLLLELCFLIMPIGKVFFPTTFLIGDESMVGLLSFHLTTCVFYWTTIRISQHQVLLAIHGIGSDNMAALKQAVKMLSTKGYIDTVAITFVVVLEITIINDSSLTFVLLNVYRGLTQLAVIAQAFSMSNACEVAFSGTGNSDDEEMNEKMAKLKEVLFELAKSAKVGSVLMSTTLFLFAGVTSLQGSWAYLLAAQYILMQMVTLKSLKVFGASLKNKKSKVGDSESSWKTSTSSINTSTTDNH